MAQQCSSVSSCHLLEAIPTGLGQSVATTLHVYSSVHCLKPDINTFTAFELGQDTSVHASQIARFLFQTLLNCGTRLQQLVPHRTFATLFKENINSRSQHCRYNGSSVYKSNVNTRCSRTRNPCKVTLSNLLVTANQQQGYNNKAERRHSLLEVNN